MVERVDYDGAVYIDFEGRRDAPPTLIGILPPRGSEGEFRQYVFDERFEGAAGARGAEMATLDQVLSILSDWALAGSHVVAWSSHERVVIDAVGTEDSRRVVAAYVDAKVLAKTWRRRVRPDLQPERIPYRGKHRLDFYLDAINYKVPTSHGPGLTGARIRELGEALAKADGRFDAFTKVRKAKWTNLLTHNRHDVLGTRAFCLRASDELRRLDPPES